MKYVKRFGVDGPHIPHMRFVTEGRRLSDVLSGPYFRVRNGRWTLTPSRVIWGKWRWPKFTYKDFT